jgi:hypothetical protein
MASIGEAIGLGNIARVERDRPFTNAVVRKQNLDLQERAARAKQQEEAKKQKQQIQGMVKGFDKSVIPYYQEDLQKVITEGINNQMVAANSGDQIGVTMAYQNMVNASNDLIQKSDKAQEILKAKQQGYYLPKVAETVLSGKKSDAATAYAKGISEEGGADIVFQLSETGDPIFIRAKQYDIDDFVKKDVRDLSDRMQVFKKTHDIDDNTAEYLYKLPQEDIMALSDSKSKDPDVIVNLKIKDKKMFDKELDAVISKNPNLNPLIAQQEAAKSVLLQKYNAANSEYRKESKSQSNNFDIDMGFGGTPEPTDPFIASDKNSLPVVVQTKAGSVGVGGNVVKKNVSLGNTNSFKMVSILSTKPAGAIDVDKNEPVKGTVFEKVDVGDIVPVPIAQRDITDKNTGISYKKGQMVDSESVKGLGMEGLVLYVPMFKAIGTYKDSEKRTQTKSMFVPASGTADAVYASQSKDDKGFTRSKIQSATKEAEQLNRTLSARFKKQATPSNSGNKGKKVAVVGADGSVTYKVQ